MNKMNQKKYGVKVEMEHTPTFKFVKSYFKKNKKLPTNKMMAEKIASDHLKEDKNYYIKIKKYKM